MPIINLKVRTTKTPDEMRYGICAEFVDDITDIVQSDTDVISIKYDSADITKERILKKLYTNLELFEELPQTDKLTVIKQNKNSLGSSGIQIINKNVNPTISSNLNSINYIWLNSTTGELFTCTSNEIDNNIWKGQLGTLIINKDITIAGIESKDLICYFNYDKLYGNQLDAQGSSNIVGTVDGVKLVTSYVNGKCAYFNKDKITLSNQELFKVSGNMTICTWIKSRNFVVSRNVIYKDNTSEFSVWIETDGCLCYSHGDGTNYKKYKSSINMSKNKWYFISIVRNNGNISMTVSKEYDEFVIDTNITSTLYGTSFDESNVAVSDNTVYFGTGLRGTLNGYLDETYIFGRNLNIVEIEKIRDKFK